LHNILLGCATFWEPSGPAGYATQKRIVWQGTIAVASETRTAATVSAVYFGYDRNHDYARNNCNIPCKGVDLVEYKWLYPDGHWDFSPFLVISDDNNDCYADSLWLDCNHDGNLETAVALPSRSILLEAVDGTQVGRFKNRCR